VSCQSWYLDFTDFVFLRMMSSLSYWYQLS
jgi:hypothetical protein